MMWEAGGTRRNQIILGSSDDGRGRDEQGGKGKAVRDSFFDSRSHETFFSELLDLDIDFIGNVALRCNVVARRDTTHGRMCCVG